MKFLYVYDWTKEILGKIQIILWTQKNKKKLEYCFAREKEIVFAQQKQSVPMSINDFVEITIFLYLIGFSIYAKMQGFVPEYAIFLFYAEIQDGRKKWGK